MADANAPVSIVIRVRNEGRLLRKTLAALNAQDGPPLEVIVVDNESTDDSSEVAREAGAIVLTLPRSEFTYGKALNVGISAATSDFVVLLSAHSLPVGPNFIRLAVKPFENPAIAAVRCVHISNRQEVEQWANQSTLTWPAELTDVVARGPVACGCAIRRSVWAQLPFNEDIKAVEDKFWAAEALKLGYLITSSPAIYLYMQEFSFLGYIRKLNKDRLCFYQHTGRSFAGHPTTRDLWVDLFYTLPRRALRGMVQDLLLAFAVTSVPLQAWYLKLQSRRGQSLSRSHSVNS